MDLSIHSHWVATQGLYFWLFNVPVTDRHKIQPQYLKWASTVQMFTQLQESNFISLGEALDETKIKCLTNAMVCSVAIQEFLASLCYESEMKDWLSNILSSLKFVCDQKAGGLRRFGISHTKYPNLNPQEFCPLDIKASSFQPAAKNHPFKFNPIENRENAQ